MDHNSLDIIGDFIAPLSEFLENFGISTMNSDDFDIKDKHHRQPIERMLTK